MTPEDIAAITAGMGKCSNYTGHDGAMQAHLATPLPPEITQDIDALESWRKLAAERNTKKNKFNSAEVHESLLVTLA